MSLKPTVHLCRSSLKRGIMARTSLHRPAVAALWLALLAGCGSDPGPAGPPPGFGTGPDPLFPAQWHLVNSGQFDGVVGVDINVAPLWAEGIKGAGSVIAIVDNGMQIGHEDLAPNVVAQKSWDYIGGDTDPTPSTPMYAPQHGTSTAGVAAARDLNGVGLRGVAPRAGLVGYNLIASEAISSSIDVVDAMTRNSDIVSASNNSWGYAPDGTGELYVVSNVLWEEAILDGVTSGRGGKGTVYVWAAGNGAGAQFDETIATYGDLNVDNSNYDDQANSPYVMAICAVDDLGVRAPYSELGANLWVCAPGGWITRGGLATTDLLGSAGINYPGTPFRGEFANSSYTNTFIGTSAAAPIVSGVVALMLEANPDLSWRDVRLILARTAVKNTASGWEVTSPAAGQPTYNIHHEYGFGLVDVEAAVQAARHWPSVGDFSALQRSSTDSGALAVVVAAGLAEDQVITISSAAGRIIEYVEVTLDLDHASIGELEVVLTAPSGTRSILAEPHNCYRVDDGALLTACLTSYFGGWTFGSARHLGEASAGDWTLSITNHAQDVDATWQSWSITVYGR